MGVIADADVFAAILTYLGGDLAVADALAGGRLGAVNAPPYPCLALTDVDADDRSLQWLTSVVVQVEALGDPSGAPGKPALRRLAYTAVEALTLMPAAASAGGIAVTAVASVSGVRWAPLPHRQPRYVTTVRLHWHPSLP